MKKLLLLLSLVLITNIIQAHIQLESLVCYKEPVNWSFPVKVETVFMTGKEINTTIIEQHFDTSAIYCLIKWSDSNTTIIRLIGYNTCTDKATKDCLGCIYSIIEGFDSFGRRWRITLI
jgi:hypothetical protein